MKNFFSNLLQIAFMTLICGFMAGCNQKESQESFSVKVSEVGPEYVHIQITAPSAVEVAYLLDTKEMLVQNPVMIFASGESFTVKPNDVVRISDGLVENTQYYLYIVAKLDEQNYSGIITLPFKTVSYDLDELITVVDQYYDGYKMRITVPEETKQRGNAIRYTQSCIMMYNYMSQRDDYFHLLYNAGRYVTDDASVVYSAEDNWYQVDSDYDGDGEMDWETKYNPISPGEPVVFTAGEFAWMEDSPEYTNEYFAFPSGWENGYYLPLIDTGYYTDGVEQSSLGIVTDYTITRPMDKYWTGAFQRKHFRIREPELFDGKVDVQLVEASPIELVLDFYPDENVVQYAVGIFDDAMYQHILDLCNGREDYLQWAISSYFGAYTFGTKVADQAVRMKLTSFYYQDAIGEDTEYHVLVTPMENTQATVQNFQKYTFSTTTRTKGRPVIEVTALEDQATPYVAAFNVKCTTVDSGNPVTECYYAANYLRDWLLQVNNGVTYYDLVAGNKAYSYFTSEEIEKINSPEGLTMTIPSIDGETTRVAVLGYNDEYYPNDLTSFENIEDCPAVADCTTPWLERKDYVDESYYTDLVGDWTATATLRTADESRTFKHSSKITIAADLYDYPSELPDEVYDIYTSTTEYTKEKVDALWDQFKEMADVVTKNRLRYQNRLVCMGWLDKDAYNRLDTYTPYELFIDKTYVSIDVSSIYNDYGPKWYIEAVKDENGNVSLVAPFDSNFLPPAANWSVPFYFSAMDSEDYYMVTTGDGWTPSFPIEVSADRNKITIKPFVHVDNEGKETVMYPNMVGMDPAMGYILENPVISEVVLTKGWNESGNQQSSLSVSSAASVKPEGNLPSVAHKKMTNLATPAVLKEIEGTVMTVEQFEERADRFIEMKFKQNND